MGNETLFRDKPVWKAIFTMAVPAVLTILIMVIYNMADMFFVAMLGNGCFPCFRWSMGHLRGERLSAS